MISPYDGRLASLPAVGPEAPAAGFRVAAARAVILGAVELTDDPGSSDHAFADWIKYVVIGILVGIPAVFMGLYICFTQIASVSSDRAWVIALWASIWAGVFAGGTGGAMVYAIRNEH